MLPLALAVATVVATPVERTNGVISKNFQHDYELMGNDHFIPVTRGSLLLHPHAYHLINADEGRGLVKRSPLGPKCLLPKCKDKKKKFVVKPVLAKKTFGKIVKMGKVGKIVKKGKFGKIVKKGKVGKTVKKGKFFGTKTVVKGSPFVKKAGKKGIKTGGTALAAPQLATAISGKIPAVGLGELAIPAIGLGGPALGLGGGALAFGVPGTGFEGFFG